MTGMFKVMLVICIIHNALQITFVISYDETEFIW